jgi:hypothetical protein
MAYRTKNMLEQQLPNLKQMHWVTVKLLEVGLDEA